MDRFLEMYQNLTVDNLHTLKEVYRDDIEFIDPAHRISGIDNLTNYFSAMYQNAGKVTFIFSEPMMDEGSGYVRWQMNFSHKRLAGGKPISIDGATYLQFDDNGMVYHHRDFFDLGAMIYEQVPLLGRVVTTIKRGLGR